METLQFISDEQWSAFQDFLNSASDFRVQRGTGVPIHCRILTSESQLILQDWNGHTKELAARNNVRTIDISINADEKEIVLNLLNTEKDMSPTIVIELIG